MDKPKAKRRQRPDTLRCAFCARHRRDVKVLVAGPRGAICDVCVVETYMTLLATGTVDAVKVNGKKEK